MGDVALFGLGASTRACAEWLATLPGGCVDSVTVFCGTADPSSAEGVAGLFAPGAVTVVAGEDVSGGPFDVGIVSPGIPATGGFYAAASAACREFMSEPELAWRASPADWVAVTGTNGKTTTTSLVRDLLEAGGVRARAVGNIGLPPIACVGDRRPGEVFAAELSSFQLQGCSRLAPRVAVLLNVTPDHVEWHGSLAAYAEAKERVFASMGAGDLAVFGGDATCRAARARVASRGVRTLVVGDEPEPCAGDAAWVDGRGRLAVRLKGRDHVLCAFDDMRLKGRHNALNALSAAASALEMGACEEGVVAGLLAFEPLAHRVEPCGQAGGILFVDDSKATNTDAVVRALESVPAGRCVVLLGGHDKGTDLGELADAVASRCSAAVAYGQAGERIAGALEAAVAKAGGCRVERAAGMREAFSVAVGLARPGDTVLLSPACSSFDEFGSYKERGDAFKSLVARLCGGGADR